MYLYNIEIRFRFKYTVDEKDYEESGNREFHVVGKDVEDVIQKTKSHLWHTIDGVSKEDDIVITLFRVNFVERITYVSF
jgi:hypothetical protein